MNSSTNKILPHYVKKGAEHLTVHEYALLHGASSHTISFSNFLSQIYLNVAIFNTSCLEALPQVLLSIKGKFNV